MALYLADTINYCRNRDILCKQPVRKPYLLYTNISGADQYEHPRSLISTFVICFLENEIAN